MLMYALGIALAITCQSLVFAAAKTKVIIRDYNQINFQDLKSYEEFSNSFLNKLTGHIEKNVYVGVATEECWDMVHSPSFMSAQRFSGGNLVTPVAIHKEHFPYTTTDNCAEVLYYKYGDILSKPSGVTTNFGDRELSNWLRAQLTLRDFKLTNDFRFSVDIYFFKESSNPDYQFTLKAGQSMMIRTFVGHVFSATAAPDTDYTPTIPIDFTTRPEYNFPGYIDIVDYFVATGKEYVFSPYQHLDICETAVDDLTTITTSSNLPYHCDDMLTTFLSFSNAIWHEKRLALNYLQPLIVRSYSPIGFEHRKLPTTTYNWLYQWYVDEWRHQAELVRSVEGLSGSSDVSDVLSGVSGVLVEGTVGPCMNQALAPSQVIHLPSHLKQQLALELQPMLEEWYGGSLTLSSIYGIR